MARPSGMCEGNPCYTAADIAEITAERDDAIDLRDDYNLQAADLEQQRNAKLALAESQNGIAEARNDELTYAQQNACP